MGVECYVQLAQREERLVVLRSEVARRTCHCKLDPPCVIDEILKQLEEAEEDVTLRFRRVRRDLQVHVPLKAIEHARDALNVRSNLREDPRDDLLEAQTRLLVLSVRHGQRRVV